VHRVRAVTRIAKALFAQVEGEHPERARFSSHNMAVLSFEVAEVQDSGDSANER